MGEPAKRLATYEDVLQAPPDKIAEVLGGELVLSPRPKPKHSLATMELGADLRNRFGRGRDGWLFLFEPDLFFGKHDILVPDIAGWKGRTLAEICDPVSENIIVHPTWVCEVLSPSTEKYDRGEKLEIYSQYNVPFCWLVNPVTRTLEVYRRKEDGRWERLLSRHDDAKVTAEPFDFELDLSHLWEG